jgi:hypothetical protein
MDAAGVDLHDEQDVEPLQAEGVEVEEVGGQQTCSLGAEEVAPRGVGVAWCGTEASGGEDPADGAGSEVVSESGEFSLDAAMALPWILAC